MDSDSLPIDIHSSKLLDWLISRRHCIKDWQPNVVKIRSKINEAIEDMPENEEIIKLLEGAYINYFCCLQIVDILKSTEADSKNFLGQYSSKRMKDWKEICRSYEKDAVYLSEAAQLLQRSVQYDIPGIKKQIAKCQQKGDECVRKENDALKHSKEAERNFEQECKKMGVAGVKIRNELLTLAQGLPQFFDQLARKTTNLKPAVQYYKNFLEYINMGPLHENVLAVPTLTYILEYGNVTFYQRKTGTVPSSIERPSFIVDEDNDNEEAEIDFGFDDDAAAVDDIDFGEFETVDSGAAEGDVETTSHDTVARGLDALSILEHTETQKLFRNDLLELSSFLKARYYDLNTEHAADFLLASVASGQMHISDKAVAAGSLGLGEIEKLRTQVSEILSELTDPYKKHLYKIRTNPKYLDFLVEDLENKKLQKEKFSRLAEVLKERGKEAGEEERQLGPRVQLLIERTKALQKHIEKDISKKYNNRKVNIMGAAALIK